MDSTSTEQSRGRGKNKRIWSNTEDAILVEIMLELHISGKAKADNGFRPGTFSQIEKILEEKLPGCGLKATPHIESRLKTLKQKFNAIQDMLFNSSGFAWDHEKKMIICEKELYDLWVKSHKEAGGLWLKPFPHFDDLGIIFGKDRANGRGALPPGQLNEEVDLEENMDTNVEVDDLEANQSMTRPAISTQGTEASTHTQRKRRKSIDSYSVNLSNMVEAITKTAEIMQQLVTSLCEPPPPPVDKMSMVFEELSKLSGLDEDLMVDASELIMKDPVKVNLFFSLPDNLKKNWVMKVLRNG